MYLREDIREVHLELTERCNAACPQCPRRIDGGILNPRLTMAELTRRDVERLLPPGFVTQLRKVYLCGNYGDPAAATDSLGIIQYLRAISESLKIGIHTNGSLRNPPWWQSLAQAIGNSGYARFAIDGLADTNHIYRRNTAWETIMANANAFMSAGGTAEWDFIVFAHNEHQVDEAREFARAAGFQAFNVKRTARFLSRQTGQQGPRAVRNRHGKNVAVLEPPSGTQYRFVAPEGSQSVECKAAREKSLYVSAEGKFFPCCYIAQMLKNPESDETHDFDCYFPHAKSQLSGVTMDQALESDLFSPVTTQCLKVCARVCGK